MAMPIIPLRLSALVQGDRSENQEPNAVRLEIEECIDLDKSFSVPLEKTSGFFLFYFDNEGKVFCDDFCFTLRHAIDHAYLQCGVKPEDWRVVKPDDWEDVVKHFQGLDKDKVIASAAQYWLSLPYHTLENYSPVYDEGNVDWRKHLKRLRADDPQYARRYDVLIGRHYQAVRIQSMPDMAHGSAWVFVDTQTGEVITSHHEE
jgi:hypothetical protein